MGVTGRQKEKPVSYSVGILGATGAVGRQMIDELENRLFPVSKLRLFATQRSQGQSVPFKGEAVQVEAIDAAGAADSFAGLQVLLSSAGSGPSKELSPIAVKAGAVVVDNSSAFRMDEGVPLVVPEINPQALDGHSGIIANPNCSTIQMVMALKPIMDAAGLKRVVVSTYQSVSGIGHKGVEELEKATRARQESKAFKPQVFPANIGFNLFPLIDRLEDGCHCREEIKMVQETRKILGRAGLPVSATTVRVPVPTGHSLALWMETERRMSRDQCISALREAPGLLVFDEMKGDATPTPDCVIDDEIIRVGRVREDPSNRNCIMLWAVGNNLRKGAATNTVQIAEELTRRGLI
jgi:aspartate-semialdehyde dehydrogenase